MNSRNAIFCATALSAFSALPAQAPTGQAERVVQFVPVGYIVADYDDPRAPLLGSLLRAGYYDYPNPHLLAQHGKASMLSIATLTEMVRSLSGGAFDEGEASLAVMGQSLVVSGAPTDVRRARQIVEELGRVITRPIQLEVALYRGRADGDYPGIIDAAELTNLTRDLALIWKGKSSTRSGRQIALGRERWAGYVGDVDIAVALKSRIGDPQVFRMFEGMRIVVEPHALSGGQDMALFCQYALGNRLGSIETRSTGVEDLPSIDVPVLATASGSMSARIASGQSLLLALSGVDERGEDLLLAVSASFLTDTATSQAGFRLFPVSALTTSALSTEISLTQAVDFKDYVSDPFQFEFPKKSPTAMTRAELNSLASDLLIDRIDAGEASVESVGGFLLVHGNDSDLGRVRSFLGNYEDLLLQTRRVRIDTSRQEISVVAHSLPVRISPDAASERLHSLTFPALIGRSHIAMRGVETVELHDFDVEIAGRSAQANPITGPAFSGVLCTVIAQPWPGGMAADFEIRLVDAGVIKRRGLEADWGGDLYLQEPTLAHFQHDGPLPASGKLSFGDGPIIRSATKHWQTTQSITIGGR